MSFILHILIWLKKFGFLWKLSTIQRHWCSDDDFRKQHDMFPDCYCVFLIWFSFYLFIYFHFYLNVNLFDLHQLLTLIVLSTSVNKYNGFTCQNSKTESFSSLRCWGRFSSLEEWNQKIVYINFLLNFGQFSDSQHLSHALGRLWPCKNKGDPLANEPHQHCKAAACWRGGTAEGGVSALERTTLKNWGKWWHDNRRHYPHHPTFTGNTG